MPTITKKTHTTHPQKSGTKPKPKTNSSSNKGNPNNVKTQKKQVYAKMSTHHQRTEQHPHLNHEKRGWELKNEKKFEEAIAEFEQGIQQHQKEYFALFGKGECLLELNKPEEAMECFMKAKDKDSKHPWAYHGIGRVYFMQGKYNTAASFFDESIKLEPGGILAQYWLGLSYEKLEEYDKAEEALKKAHKRAISRKSPSISEDKISEAMERVHRFRKSKEDQEKGKPNITVYGDYTDARLKVGDGNGDVSIIICSKCLTENRFDDIFCKRCGAKLR